MSTPISEIPVVILCGGQGTRIREASERLPKPLIDIGGKPVLWHIMKSFGHHGFRRFVLCLGYRSWDIKEYFLRYRENLSDFTVELGSGDVSFSDGPSADDWEVTCVDTGIPTGTGGRLVAVREHLGTDEFMVTYGDGVADVDPIALLTAHREGGNVVTVTGVQPGGRYGELSIEGDRVVEFAEKPDSADAFVSGGFFVMQSSFIDRIGSDPSVMFEQDPLRTLASDGHLGVYRHTGFWVGMDTFREYTALNKLWASGDAPWKVW